MKCPKCKAQSPNGKKFCGECGTAFPTPPPTTRSPVTAREKGLVAATCVLAVILVIFLAMGQIGHKPSLNLVSWDYDTMIYNEFHRVIYSVTVMNEGDAVGNATIRCSAQIGNETAYGSLAIFLSPGEVQSYRITAEILDDYPWGAVTNVTCTLITF